MYVVRHQAIRDDVDDKLPGMLTQQSQIRCMVTQIKKHTLTVVTSLCDVMWDTGNDNARMSRHTRTIFPEQAV